MTGEEKDPALFGDDEARANYRQDVMRQVRETIEEDRRNRRESPKNETPAVLIGGTGLSSGLIQSL